MSVEPARSLAAICGGGGCGRAFAVSVSRTTLAVEAALCRILLATSPPCLIAREFNERVTKGRPSVGSPRIEDGFGVLEEFLGVLALAG